MPTPIPAGLTLGAVEPKEAFAAFARRGLLKQSFRWQDVWQSEHARAFTVAGVMRDDVLKIFQDELRASLAEGRSLGDFQEQVTSRLTGKGFWGNVQVTDPATGETRISRFDDRRLRLIFDVNLRQSHAAGRWERIERNKATHPFVMYRTMNDERVRASHKPWHGLVLPVDDPFWHTHYPPNGWRCRCIAFAVSERDIQKYAAAGQPVKRQAPPVRYIDYVNPHTDEVRAVPAGIDPGFGYNPGRAAQGHMAQAASLQGASIAQLDAPIGAAVGKVLPQQTRQVLADAYREWLAAVQQPGSDKRLKSVRPVIGALDPLDVAWLFDHTGEWPASADIGVSSGVVVGPKAQRHADKGDALPQQMLEQLPELLGEPVAVLYDVKTGTLLYILPDLLSQRGQAGVEVAITTQAVKAGNVLKSAYRPVLVDVLARLAAGALQLVRGTLGPPR